MLFKSDYHLEGMNIKEHKHSFFLLNRQVFFCIAYRRSYMLQFVCLTIIYILLLYEFGPQVCFNNFSV